MTFCKNRKMLAVAIALFIVGGYGTVLAWFHWEDFYHRNFFQPGSGVILYNFARLLFIFYIALIVYLPGAGLMRLAANENVFLELKAWERYPLGFIIGAALWHVLLFWLGLASLDTKPVAVILTVGCLIAGIPHLAACLCDRGAALLRAKARVDELLRDGTIVAVVACCLAAAAFLIVKGLYPNGGSDYIGHYYYFYKRVVETGSILPNDVWYHFYYSKGLGLYFLSMLLTDALAPQLVASAFIGIGATIVYGILRHSCRSNLVPYAGVLLYVTLLTYTPGPPENAANGGWADLEKTHELTAVLLLSIVWIVSRLSDRNCALPRVWMLALLGAVVSLSVITLPLSLLAGLYFAGYLFWFVLMREWRQAIWPLAAGISAVLCIIAIASINYYYTGLPSDQGMTFYWPYANLKKMQEWGVLPEIIWGHWYNTQYQAKAVPISFRLLVLFWEYLRLEIWWPIISTAIAFLAIKTVIGKRFRPLPLQRSKATFWALVGFAATVLIVAFFGGGRTQYISFYRMSSFSYGPTLCLALYLWDLAFQSPLGQVRSPVAGVKYVVGVGLPIFCAVSAFSAEQRQIHVGNIGHIAVDSFYFATGKHSIKAAFQHQAGRPARSPWGGIYEGIVPAWKIAGPHTRIWAFHPGSVCMLPDCNLQGFPAMRLSRQWGLVFFGEPTDAVAALKSEGLNYFFFTKDLGVADILPAARLFSPELIAENLAIRWSDGTSYLLTWPGPDTHPIDDKFLAAYSEAVSQSGLYKPFKTHIADWEAIASHIAAHREDLHPFDLPWCQKCTLVPLRFP